MAYHSDSDLLSRILSGMHLRAEVFAHADYCGVWQLDTSGSGRAAFHLVGRGACWLDLGQERPPVPLNAGDMVLFPRDARHEIRADATGREGSETTTTVMCGYFDFGDQGHNPVLDALPDVIHVPAEDAADSGAVAATTRLLFAEARKRHPGRQLVLDRLSEALFVLVLRHVLERSDNRRGLLAALSDHRLARALDAMHRHPGRPWSVASLAREAAMSRTAFSVAFSERVGVPPIRYLTELRLRLADRMLRDGGLSVTEVAERAGYGDETSFRRAFSRFFGVGPGVARRGQESRNLPVRPDNGPSRGPGQALTHFPG